MKKAKEAAVQYQTEVAQSVPGRSSVTVEAGLAEQLRQAADWNGVTVEEATDAALLDYYYRYASAKIKQEQAIFEQRKPELLKRYRGQYIAMHNGEVVAHAPDLSSLHKKVFARFGRTPILHKQVLPEPDRVYVIRSPRLVRP
jgi:hypothetical protein